MTDLASGEGTLGFAGKVVVVTGAGSGIGRATALLFSSIATPSAIDSLRPA